MMTYRGTKQCVRKTTGHTAQLSVPGRCPRGSFASLSLVFAGLSLRSFIPCSSMIKKAINSKSAKSWGHWTVDHLVSRKGMHRKTASGVCWDRAVLFHSLPSRASVVLLTRFPYFFNSPCPSWILLGFRILLGFCFLSKPTIAASHDSKSQHLQGLQVLNYISSLTIKNNNK